MNNFGVVALRQRIYKLFCVSLLPCVVGDYAHIIPFRCDENSRDDEGHRPLRFVIIALSSDI